MDRMHEYYNNLLCRGYYKHCEMKGDNVLSNTVLVGHDHLIN